VPGTIISAIQAGTAALGTGVSGVNVFTVTFPSPFSATPKVIFSPRNEGSQTNADDVYAVTTCQVTNSYFVVNVLRLDVSGGWGQNLQLDWFAAQ
jgi:H-type lectin domain